MHRNRGFTLTELLIVVAIIGILTAIAYPSYRESVSKGNRSECEGALVGFAGAMERFFTDNNTYIGAGTVSSNTTGAPTIYPTQCPLDGGSATYNLTISAATASTYTLQAAPTGGQANDRCGTLTINSQNVKTASGGTVADCWH